MCVFSRHQQTKSSQVKSRRAAARHASSPPRCCQPQVGNVRALHACWERARALAHAARALAHAARFLNRSQNVRSAATTGLSAAGLSAARLSAAGRLRLLSSFEYARDPPATVCSVNRAPGRMPPPEGRRIRGVLCVGQVDDCRAHRTMVSLVSIKATITRSHDHARRPHASTRSESA